MISIFKHSKCATSERNLSEQTYFDGVKNGQWQDEVLNYRANPTPDSKRMITCVTASGVFRERKSNLLIEHSGFICIDIDAKDQICKIDIEAIKKDPYTYCVHQSVGGYGYAVFIKIDGEKHLEAFLGLENYLFVNYSIVIDKSCKDVSRLRFVSYDPSLFINEKSKVFKTYLKKVEVKKRDTIFTVVKSDFDEMVNRASSMNLFDDYNEYVKLAFALSNEFGNEGLRYFHSLCSSSSKYNPEKAEKDYNIAVKRNKSGITIASVYFKFKEAGIPITSEKTEKIKMAVKLSENPKKYLEEQGIEDDENLIEKFEKPLTSSSEIDQIIELIKINKVRFNEVTRNFELNGVEMTDRILAKFYQAVWTRIDDGIAKDKIFTLIQNRDNSPSYNPIHDWFYLNRNLVYDDEFEKLKKCFKIDCIAYEDGKAHIVDDYLDVFLKKWLIGIVGSAFGTYSLMILVLNGEQGTKKTEFFRNLLPEDLRKFYAESNLDEGKDSEILMTKKLLIVDDEFGGKSKKDATKLKRLSSQQTFTIRMPYGKVSEDLMRLAVLGGTTNDSEIINDVTGNRRIIPINLIDFDIENYLKIDKNKLFIELYNEWKNNKNGWFLDKIEIDVLNKSSLKNTEVMTEVELIDKYMVKNIYNSLTNTDIKLKLESRHNSLRTSTKRIGQALKLCGHEQKIKKIGTKTVRCYELMFNDEQSVTAGSIENQMF
jgi:predicted P-loop ATPase